MEFGARKGLAQVLDWDRRVEMDRYNANQQRQAKIQAEQKAKMFADDFDYNNAMNSHDNPLVKQFAMNKIMELGGFFRENPDWQTDPFKMSIYKAKIHELKDNPDLNRGLLSDANFKKMNEYLSDPKNAEMANDPEIKKSFQQWNNYLKFGNQFATSEDEVETFGGKREFRFIPPEEGVDTTKILMDIAGQTEYDDIQTFGYQKSGMRQSVSSSRKDLAVEHALASTWGKYLRKDYDKYQSQFNGNEKSKAKTLNAFVRERMEPYFKSEKLERAYQMPVIKPPTSGDGLGGSAMNRNMWFDMHDKAVKTPGQKIDFSSEPMNQTFGNKFGEHNLTGVKDPFGNIINLGLRKASATGRVEVKQTGDGKSVYAEYEALVRLPVNEFMALGDDYNKVIDEGGFGQIFPGGPGADATNWSIHEEYRNDFKPYVDESGRQFVEFSVNQKYDPFNVNLADNYSNAHNVKQHDEDPYSMGEEASKSAVVSSDGKWAWNGTKWVPIGK